ncbi:hypothetical protein DCAR_0933553 [Daucus carota subsp. sativus]|uniref:Uncharacterized protein n=1 Tax=Daucus carota subsp. sativus TaxID=79200 RepID=A0AAF0XVE6_DAUCS|nr:PREDICTED: uncharacterized protein LOC108201039 [Daucus carota subsp. sativus]WOH14037.1 hypothetical protein DCAR_0933553 [Daucus carota subsp. sativus]
MMDMSGEKKMEQSETVVPELKSDVYTPIIEEVGAAGEKGMKSNTTSFISYSEDVIHTVNGYNRNSNSLDESYFGGSNESYTGTTTNNFFTISLAVVLYYRDFDGC